MLTIKKSGFSLYIVPDIDYTHALLLLINVLLLFSL